MVGSIRSTLVAVFKLNKFIKTSSNEKNQQQQQSFSRSFSENGKFSEPFLKAARDRCWEKFAVKFGGSSPRPSSRWRSPGEAPSVRRQSALTPRLSSYHELSPSRDTPGNMAATDYSRSEAAKQRRRDQLQRWLGSETDRTAPEARQSSSSSSSSGGSGTRRAKVRFAQGAVFMAACSAGDREEVSALLRQGADINHANIDGLTALHQVGGLTPYVCFPCAGEPPGEWPPTVARLAATLSR